jgi:hypothetical protein
MLGCIEFQRCVASRQRRFHLGRIAGFVVNDSLFINSKTSVLRKEMGVLWKSRHDGIDKDLHGHGNVGRPVSKSVGLQKDDSEDKARG